MDMKVMKRIAMGVAAAFVLGFGAMTVADSTVQAASANNGATIGFVDASAVQKNAQEYKNIKSVLAAEAENLQKEFDEKSAGLSDAEKKQLFSQYQQRLNLKERELVMKAEEKVLGVIKEIATAQGLTLVLDKSNVFFGGKDITQDVIQKLSK